MGYSLSTTLVGPRWIPAVTCPCGQGDHHPGARYYVSVQDGARTVLALGPFLTHPEALARVDRVSRVVIDRFNPHGRAHFYAYGTVAMPYTYTEPGRLNGEFGG